MQYGETEDQRQIREAAFTFHPPKGNQGERYARLRMMANQLSLAFNHSCPRSRELSIAQTKLEEAVMFANAAIARNE